MTIIGRKNAEHYDWGNGCDGWRLLARQDLSVIEERIPPGLGEVPHFHTQARQLFYVLSGRLRIDVQGESLTLRPGESLEVLPGATHRVHNPFELDAVFLVISAPTTAGDRTNVG
jgi:mannose-6-phosphate isomerase-like protein (cupin superfamily)